MSEKRKILELKNSPLTLRKRERKKRELAISALEVLSETGYASASLRDIAKEAGVSLGVLHYYFPDKAELICYCLAVYKETFIGKLSDTFVNAESADEMIPRFIMELVNSIDTDAKIHRIWYDIRSQAVFDKRFEFVITDLENKLALLFQQFWTKIGSENYTGVEMYAMFDGLFRYALQRHLLGDKFALRDFESVSTKLIHELR